jgi:tetratricopeptide (TPR) repeat protein
MTLAHTGEEDHDTARELATEAVSEHPGQAVLANNLAVLLEVAGSVAEADQVLRDAFEQEPTLPQISKNLGDLFYRAGNYDEAYASYERTAKLSPDLGDDLYFKLGNLAYKRNDRERAKGYWERATMLNAGHQLARANLDMLENGE